MRKFATLVLLLVVAVTAACSAVPATGDTATQYLSAQSQMPAAPRGYTQVNAESIQGALSAAATATSLSTANLLGAGLVNRVDALVSCYRDVGAIDVKAYYSILEAGGGVAIVINNNRVANNLVQCIAQAAGGMSPQDAAFPPCVIGGSFSATEGEITNAFSFIYIGSTPNLCNSFQAHFAGKGAVITNP